MIIGANQPVVIDALGRAAPREAEFIRTRKLLAGENRGALELPAPDSR